MGMGSPPKPSINMPPPAAHPAILGSGTNRSSLQAQKDRSNAEQFTADNTIATSPQGLKAPETAKNTLLGQ